MDKHAFILGMVAAFCECVAAGCKPLALSPPLLDADCADVEEQARALIAAHGLCVYHEENLDLPEAARVHWLVIYAREETIGQYLQTRAQGHNPALDIDAFADVLGYAWERIITGYDAYHDLFGK